MTQRLSERVLRKRLTNQTKTSTRVEQADKELGQNRRNNVLEYEHLTRDWLANVKS